MWLLKPFSLQHIESVERRAELLVYYKYARATITLRKTSQGMMMNTLFAFFKLVKSNKSKYIWIWNNVRVSIWIFLTCVFFKLCAQCISFSRTFVRVFYKTGETISRMDISNFDKYIFGVTGDFKLS